MKFVGKYLIPITNSSESDNYYVYRGDLANQTMEDILSPDFFDNSTLEDKCLLKINATNGDGLYIISKDINNNIIINNNIGVNSLIVESPNNTIVQIGDSTTSNQALTVKLEANIDALIPSYNTFDDLPDPTTLPAGSYASVTQGTSGLANYEPAGLYQVLQASNLIKYWNYLGTYADNYTIIYDNVFKVNTGTTANKIVQLDSNAKIPAVDASQTTVGTIVPENNQVVTNDNLNTTANKLQGQINTLLNIINSSNGLQPVMLYFDTNQTLSGLPTQGDYTCVDNDRVICTNQTNPAENLIYNVHADAWTIESDSEKVNELLGGWTEIIKGTYNNSYTYLVSITPNSGDVIPTSVTWSTPVPSGLYQAGNGLNLTGSVFSASFEANTSNIKMDGPASVGTTNNIPRSDHVHPSDTTKQNLISPATANNIVTMNVDGQVIDSGKKFSTDVALTQNSNDNISTEAVVKYNVDYLNNRINNLPVGGGQGVLYYLTDDTNGSYLTLSTTPKNNISETFLFGTVNADLPRVLLGSFATALPLNKTTLDAGIWEFNFWCRADNEQPNTYVYVEVYTLSSTNVETLLFTINNNNNIGSLNSIIYSISSTEASYPILSTDKLLIKIYADTTRNQDTVVVLDYNTQQSYSHMHTPISGVATDGVTSFNAGTTGFTPNLATNGVVTLAGTLNIANGGTGQTTANNALNALLPTQTGNANKVLFTDGTNTSWILRRQPKISRFTASGTWTPDPTALYVIIEAQGAGGGSSTVNAPATGISFSNSGGGGGYIKALFPTQTVAIAVTVGTSSANNAGSASSVGTLVNAPGGAAGSTISLSVPTGTFAVTGTTPTSGGGVGTQSGGTVIHTSGGAGVAQAVATIVGSSSVVTVVIQNGGNSQLGVGGRSGQDFGAVNLNGATGTGYGSGGGGSAQSNGGAAVGVAGTNGIVIITEYYF